MIQIFRNTEKMAVEIEVTLEGGKGGELQTGSWILRPKETADVSGVPKKAQHEPIVQTAYFYV